MQEENWLNDKDKMNILIEMGYILTKYCHWNQRRGLKNAFFLGFTGKNGKKLSILITLGGNKFGTNNDASRMDED